MILQQRWAWMESGRALDWQRMRRLHAGSLGWVCNGRSCRKVDSWNLAGLFVVSSWSIGVCRLHPKRSSDRTLQCAPPGDHLVRTAWKLPEFRRNYLDIDIWRLWNWSWLQGVFVRWNSLGDWPISMSPNEEWRRSWPAAPKLRFVNVLRVTVNCWKERGRISDWTKKSRVEARCLSFVLGGWAEDFMVCFYACVSSLVDISIFSYTSNCNHLLRVLNSSCISKRMPNAANCLFDRIRFYWAEVVGLSCLSGHILRTCYVSSDMVAIWQTTNRLSMLLWNLFLCLSYLQFCFRDTNR